MTEFASRPDQPTALLRGILGRCPNCGTAPLFRAYLKQVDACAACATRFGHIRADDFPPYLTILVVGHIVVPSAVLSVEYLTVSTAQLLAIFLPLTAVLMVVFLPRLKGLILALMWTLGLTGAETQGVEAEGGD
ncbi:MAG: DUF983 domain-containing protein [Rhodospirillaceae bacterium]